MTLFSFVEIFLYTSTITRRSPISIISGITYTFINSIQAYFLSLPHYKISKLKSEGRELLLSLELLDPKNNCNYYR